MSQSGVNSKLALNNVDKHVASHEADGEADGLLLPGTGKTEVARATVRKADLAMPLARVIKKFHGQALQREATVYSLNIGRR